MNNLGYQMQGSVALLEEQLAEESNPHVLQLNLQWEGDDWRNPTAWDFYADGTRAASETGAFARAAFCESASAFMRPCRNAVESAQLPSLDERELYLFKCCRAIAPPLSHRKVIAAMATEEDAYSE